MIYLKSSYLSSFYTKGNNMKLERLKTRKVREVSCFFIMLIIFMIVSSIASPTFINIFYLITCIYTYIAFLKIQMEDE